MMKAAALAVSGLLFVAPCERPPVEYQGVPDHPVRMFFADPAFVDAVCREAAGIPPGGPQILACTNVANNTILMPHPCLYDDGFARLACHEVAHTNGWVHG